MNTKRTKQSPCVCVCAWVLLVYCSTHTKMSGGGEWICQGGDWLHTFYYHVILVFSTLVTTITHPIFLCTLIMFLKMLMEPESQIKASGKLSWTWLLLKNLLLKILWSWVLFLLFVLLSRHLFNICYAPHTIMGLKDTRVERMSPAF